MAVLSNDFTALFGSQAAVQAEAPGRVNLIGEHTDYNGGFVLPTPIPRHCRISLLPRLDQRVRLASRDFGDQVFEYELGKEQARQEWIDYVQGTTSILQADGHALKGFEAFIDSDVPLGSGLSSSAALDVAMMRALREAFHLNLNDLDVARYGQRIENEFVGARVGIMDPMACSLGREGYGLFIDTKTLERKLVPLPLDAELVVINSNISHQHAGGDYNTRRAECERACELLGVAQLRDLGLKDLPKVEKLPEPFNRRARHVITENDRVLKAVDQMEAGDCVALGLLCNESHASQRDDYQVSIPEIDLLVAIAQRQTEVFGARLTGGGFGGSILALARAGTGKSVGEQVIDEFLKQSGRQASLMTP